MHYLKARALVTIAIVALVTSTHVYSQSGNGVLGQLGELNSNVGEISNQIGGLSDALEQLEAAASKGTPIQLLLAALFEVGDINAFESGLGPISFTAPEGKSMLIKFVRCRAVRGDNEIHQFDIGLVTSFVFEGFSTPAELVQFVPTSVWESPGPFGDRAVASTPTHAYLNIPSPAEGAPEIGNVLRLRAQRNGTTGSGGVECTVSGVLFPRPGD